MRINFVIKALDNLSISQTHAGAFSDNSLDYIPGSALLGIFASKLYPNVDHEAAWNLFQSGETRFSNCYPMSKEKTGKGYFATLPAPYALHYLKRLGSYEKSREENQIYNCLNAVPSEQAKQLRSGYMLSDGSRAIGIKTSSVIKTAICDETQTAEEHNLFVTGYILKGTVFYGFIDGDEAVVNKIKDIIKNENGIFRIGKSRGSEFGRIKLDLVDKQLYAPADQSKDNDKKLILWCLSDVEFFDITTGMPSTKPLTSNLIFGKDIKGKFNFDNSFIRTDSIRFYNRKRNGFDGERIVVKKGSVITFDLDRPLSDDELSKISQEGIGLDRQLGFGQVMVNPKWLSTTKILSNDIKLFKNNEISTNVLSNIETNTIKDDRLLTWINAKLPNIQKQALTEHISDEINKEIYRWYKLARDTNRLYQDEVCGPSSTQLGRILDLIKNNIQVKSYNEKLSEQIISKIKAICDPKTDNLGWGIRAQYDGIHNTDFGSNYINLVKDHTYQEVIYHIESLTKHDPSLWDDLREHI